MNNNLRNQLQELAASKAYECKFHSILELSPRFGKTLTALKAFEKLSRPINLLVLAPYNTILESWKSEIKLWGSKHNITLCNNRSIGNIDWSTIDAVILDECHCISENQITILASCNKPILGLTGSLSMDSKKMLKTYLKLKVGYTYSIEDAIRDGIIADFSINIHHVELDNTKKVVEYGSKAKPLIGTELEAYNYASSNFDRFKYMSYSNPALSGVKMKYAGERSRIIYGSINKIKKAKSLLRKTRKTLIFTGLTKVADAISDNSYHSKSVDSNFESFLTDSTGHLAVVNMANMGVTVRNLKHIIINQLQSKEENSIQRIMRAMNFEGKKKATIDIIVVKNTVDEDWVNKALQWVDKSKIHYKN